MSLIPFAPFGDMMANEQSRKGISEIEGKVAEDSDERERDASESQTSVSRVADRENLSLLLDKARQFAGEYIDSLEQRPVFPGERSLRAMDALVESLPENPSDPFLVLDQLQEIGAPAVVTQTAGRYFGFVNGGALPVGLAARWMADVWDQNTAHYVMSRSIRVSKKSANVGSSRCLVCPKKLQPVLYPEQQLPISQACVPVATNCFADAAGTLPARVFTARQGLVSSPAPMRTQRSTNRFRCSDSDPKTSSLFPWTIRDACEPIECRQPEVRIKKDEM
jgi:hypothetical protein